MFASSIKKSKSTLELAVNRRFRLSKTSVWIVDTLLENLFERILYDSTTMLMKDQKTLDADTVADACYVAFSGQLGRQMRSEALVEAKAKDAAVFLPGKIHKRIKRHILMTSKRVSPKAAIALALALEYITFEILMLAFDEMTLMKAKTIRGLHLAQAIRRNCSLKNFASEVHWNPARYGLPTTDPDFALVWEALS